MAAVKSGVGREEAHEVIKRHAVSEALRLRQSDDGGNRLAELIADDPVFAQAGIKLADIAEIWKDKVRFTGRAREQIAATRTRANALLSKYAGEAKYEPGDIL